MDHCGFLRLAPAKSFWIILYNCPSQGVLKHKDMSTCMRMQVHRKMAGGPLEVKVFKQKWLLWTLMVMFHCNSLPDNYIRSTSARSAVLSGALQWNNHIDSATPLIG